MTSIFAVAYALAQLPAGVAGTAFGSGRILGLSLVLLGVAFVIASQGQSMATLVGTRIVTGVTAGSMMPLAAGLVRSADERRNSVRQGVMGSGWGVGYVVGLTLIPLLFVGWREASLGLGLLSLALGVLALTALPREEGGAEWSLRPALAGLARPGAWILGGCMFGVALVNSGIGAWALVYLRDELGLSDSRAGGLVSLIGWGLIPASILGIAFARRFGERLVFLTTAGSLTAALALIALPTGEIGIGVALFTVGVFSGFPLGVVLGLVQVIDPTPGARGQAAATGALNLVAFFANVVAPPLVGFTTDAVTDLPVSFLALVIGPVITVTMGSIAIRLATSRS